MVLGEASGQAEPPPAHLSAQSGQSSALQGEGRVVTAHQGPPEGRLGLCFRQGASSVVASVPRGSRYRGARGHPQTVILSGEPLLGDALECVPSSHRVLRRRPRPRSSSLFPPGPEHPPGSVAFLSTGTCPRQSFPRRRLLGTDFCLGLAQHSGLSAHQARRLSPWPAGWSAGTRAGSGPSGRPWGL